MGHVPRRSSTRSETTAGSCSRECRTSACGGPSSTSRRAGCRPPRARRRAPSCSSARALPPDPERARRREPGGVRRPSVKRRIGVAIVLVLIGLAIALTAGWGALVLFYLAPGSESVRQALAWTFAALGVVVLGALPVRRARWPAVVGFVAALAVVLVVWRSAQPSNDRDWQPEVAVLPWAEIDGDRVTVHNIRNFDYRTETDFTPAYYDRTFDLRRLDRVDLIAVYWMGPAIAHMFVSFGF